MLRVSLRFLATVVALQVYPAVTEAQQLTVGTFTQSNLYQYAGPTGPAPGTVIAGPVDGVFGIAGLAQRPNDNGVFISAQFSDGIFKYSPGAGVSPVILPSTMNLVANGGVPGPNSYGPSNIAFGSDGLLYVARSGGFAAPTPGAGAIDRFDVSTGQFVSSVITGLSGTVGVTANGTDLYVSNRVSPTFSFGNVLKISNYTTTPTVTNLIPGGTGTMAYPVSSVLGPDNKLYVADVGDELGSFGPPRAGAIHRYNPVTGAEDLAFSMPMPGLSPSGLFFLPDGKLLVANLGTNFSGPFNGNVQIYDVQTNPTAMLLSTVEGGLMASTVIVAVPEPGLLLLVAGSVIAVRRRGNYFFCRCSSRNASRS